MAKVIICVDDELAILRMVRGTINDNLDVERYICDIAESAEEGLEIIEEHLKDSDEIAIVIADQMMPGMKGDEFLIEVNRRLPETIKILLTGEAGLDSAINAINNAGLYRYITKPWEENFGS